LTAYDSLFKRLAQRDKITPFFEHGVLSQKWPDEYTITIDSSPYYGLGDGKFHPSTHPLMGERLLWYMFHPEFADKLIHEKRTVMSEMTLAMGSAIHGIMQTQFTMMGLCKEEDIEVEYGSRQHNVRGRLDFLVHHPNGETIPVELKTQNVYAFSRQKEMKLEWDIQLSLEEDCLGYSEGVLLVAEAGWPYTLKEYHHSRNDNLLSQTYTKFDNVRTAVALDRPPKACCALNSAEMTSCPARHLCWLSKNPRERPDG